MNRVHRSARMSKKKEVNTMRKQIVVALLSIAGVLFVSAALSSAYAAGTVITSSGVAITAEVGSTVSFGVRARTYAGVAVTSVTFGNTVGYSTWTVSPNQYVEITLNDNWWNWNVEIYTNNFWRNNQDGTYVGVSSTTWGFAYGGMIESTTTPKKMPMAWAVRQGANAGLYGNSAPGVIGSSWTYITDKSNWLESNILLGQGAGFDDAEAAGYPNVMYGNHTGINIVRGDFPSGQQAQAATSPVAVMVSAQFPAAAGNYSTKLWFDLIHQ